MLAGCGASTSLSSSVPCTKAGNVSRTQNALVAEFELCSKSAASAYVEFGPDTSYGLRTSSEQSASGKMTFLVAGMKQNTTYHMRAVVTAKDGSKSTGPDHTFRTGVLPDSSPPVVQVKVTPGMRPSPGVELAALSKQKDGEMTVVAFDNAGNPIWYYDYDPALGIAQPIKLLPNGNMLLVLYAQNPNSPPGGTVREIDLAGNVVDEFTFDDLNKALAAGGFDLKVTSLNHDVAYLPNGHMILLGSDDRTTSVLGVNGLVDVISNDLVDIDQNNKPVWVWKAFDHLDVNRHPFKFPDWTHANSVVYSPSDGNLLLSLRHQSWVVKIDYEDGKGNGDILWRLGYQGDFTLASGVTSDWFFAEHYATFFSSNTTGKIQIGVFDNGDDRIINGALCGATGAPACYSRAAVFDVDEDAKTASLNWAYREAYSAWGGVTQSLENSNVFVDESAPADNFKGARVQEVTGGANPKLVWSMDIGQNSYRTIHLPSLYPGVDW